jgi:hypothetical protein
MAAKQIDKLAERPVIGEPLGHRLGLDLTGYRKLYFGKKSYRIVYEIRAQEAGDERRGRPPASSARRNVPGRRYPVPRFTRIR